MRLEAQDESYAPRDRGRDGRHAVRPAGLAALVDVPPGSGARWRQALLDLVADGALPAPDEIVPGHRSVLVDGISASAWPAPCEDCRRREVDRMTAATVVEIPTVYDGADLAEVARLWDTDVAGVVKRHAATDFEVAFCGFAPGFPYLVGLDEDVPRRATPRTRVPAGAVALAGRFCGIYPTASPGGWQLIGRTGRHAVRRRPRPACAAAARHPGALRAASTTSRRPPRSALVSRGA